LRELQAEAGSRPIFEKFGHRYLLFFLRPYQKYNVNGYLLRAKEGDLLTIFGIVSGNCFVS
jgi:hypothetical protein